MPRSQTHGFVNAHTHLYSGLAPLGMPPVQPKPTNFLEILQRVWWRLDRALDEPTLRAAARYHIAHALRAGTTGLIDHHESPDFIEGSLDVLADVCQEMGIRAVLCYGATERNGGREEAQRGLAECKRFILAQRASDRWPLVRGMMGLHASFTVSDETLREAGRLCRELKVPLHVHMAEDWVDVTDARKRRYAGPLQRLMALDALPAGSVLAHGVRLDADEVSRAGSARAWLVQNPRSNRNNAVGYPKFLQRSPLVALGTDGFESDMQEEAAILSSDAAMHGEPFEVVRQRQEGSGALLAQLFGDDVLREDVVELEGRRVINVTMAGRPRVRDGKHVDIDLVQIEARARERAQHLWARMFQS
jgi:cytosine/adenosine deaminase-related metal-dependent hydrolase